MRALRPAGGKSPGAAPGTLERVLSGSLCVSANMFPQNAAHAETGALGQDLAPDPSGIAEAPGLPDAGFALVKSQVFCSWAEAALEKLCFSSHADLPVSSPHLVDPSFSVCYLGPR